MPLVPNFLERQIFLTLNLAPAPMLDIFSAISFRVVVGAVRLGVFEALAGSDQTADQVASQIKAAPESTAMLLDTLETLGYVEKKGSAYRNTAMTTKWLVGDGMNLAPYYRFWGTNLFKLWDSFEDTIRRGEPTLNLYEWIEEQPETSRDFQEGMITLAKLGLKETVNKIKLPDTATRLIDVGGGHAMYSVALCQKYPQLSAVVYDSPQALATGRDNVKAAGMDGRISFEEGNFMTDLGSGYDVLLLFNIVHGFDADGNRAMLARMAKALKPGGQIIIAEQLLDTSGSQTLTAVKHLLGMAYFQLLNGQIYPFNEVSEWLTSTGFSRIQRINLLSGSSLIIGTKS